MKKKKWIRAIALSMVFFTLTGTTGVSSLAAEAGIAEERTISAPDASEGGAQDESNANENSTNETDGTTVTEETVPEQVTDNKGTDGEAQPAAEETAGEEQTAVVTAPERDAAGDAELQNIPGEPDAGHTGHAHVGETLYLVDLYPDQRQISYVKTYFSDQQPTLVKDQSDPAYRSFKQADGSALVESYMVVTDWYYSVKIPQHPGTTAENIDDQNRPVLNWVWFEIHMADGSVLPHYNAYNYMGTDDEYNNATNTIQFSFEIGKKNTIFVGHNEDEAQGNYRTWSYVGAHPGAKQISLVGQNIYFDCNTQGQTSAPGKDEFKLKWLGENGEAVERTLDETYNDGIFIYRFKAEDNVTQNTVFVLERTVEGQVYRIRFVYSVVGEYNMLNIDFIDTIVNPWMVYETNLTDKTERSFMFNNFVSDLDKDSVYIGKSSQPVTDNIVASDQIQWTKMTLSVQPASPKDSLYFIQNYDITNATYIYFKGTHEGQDYVTDAIEQANVLAFDHPTLYAKRAANNKLDGIWKNVWSISELADTVQNVETGTFQEDPDAYYGRATMYDYYSNKEHEGVALDTWPYKETETTEYRGQGQTFNKALSEYYKKYNVDAGKVLYFGVSNDIFPPSLPEGLYGIGKKLNAPVNGFIDNKRLALGLMDEKLTNGNITQGETVVPFFDENFLRGNNAYQATLGQVYNQAIFKFKKNTDGYWEYDSNKAADARVLKQDPDEGYYMDNREHPLNNQMDRGPGFFPFGRYDKDHNYVQYHNDMFGMRMDIPFSLTSDGTVLMPNKTDREPIKFNFTGDDDVWIYVDDQLVLDLGGTHGTNGGTINFQTGEVTYNESYKDGANNIIPDPNPISQELLATLKDGLSHKLSIFYLERGLYDSNLKITFNFITENKLTVSNSIDTSAANQEVFGEALKNMSGLNYYLFNKAVSGASLPVEQSQGYINPGAKVTLVDGTETAVLKKPDSPVKDAITLGSVQDTQLERKVIEYTNNAPSPNTEQWIDGEDDAQNRMASIPVTGNPTLGQKAEYLYMKFWSNTVSYSGARLYVQITFTDDTKWGSSAATNNYTGYSNGFYANQWNEIRMDLKDAPETKPIKSIEFAGYSEGMTLRVAEVSVHEPLQEVPATGFSADQSKISDYGSVNTQVLEPVTNIPFMKREQGSTQDETLAFTDGLGVFTLHSGQEATFTEKFRYGSYLFLHESVPDNDGDLFDTTYSIQEKGANGQWEDIDRIYMLPGRYDVTSVENASEVVNVTDVKGRTAGDGRSSKVNGAVVDNGVTGISDIGVNPPYPTMVYRSYSNPDVIEERAIDLKVAYENILKVGSVTVKKVLTWPGEEACGMTWNEFRDAFLDRESVTFRLTFTDVAGQFLETYVDGDVTAELEVKLTSADNDTHTLTGTATLDGIPAMTRYKIEEIQSNGIQLTGISGVQVESGEGIKSHELLGTGNSGIGGSGSSSYGEAVAYQSNATFTYENTFVGNIDIPVRKKWDATVPAGEQGQITVQLQRKSGNSAWTNVGEPQTTVNYETTFQDLPTVDEQKNVYKYRVVEDNPSGKFIVFYNNDVDGGITLINASVERKYYVQNGVKRELPILPEKEKDKQHVADNYTITITSADSGMNVTDTLFEILADGTINYTAPDIGVEVYDVNFLPNSSDLDKVQQTIRVAVYAYDTGDDIYVLDYGLPAKLADKAHPGQEVNGETGESVLKSGLFANDVYQAVLNDSVTNEIAGIAAVKENESQRTYGSSVEETGWNGRLDMTQESEKKGTDGTDVTFTPTRFMERTDVYSYKTIIRDAKHPTTAEGDITAENGVVMTADVKVLPANVVYYEDNFANTSSIDDKGIHYSGSYEGVTIDNTEQKYQSIDQDEAYGHDDAYNDAQSSVPGKQDSLGSSTQLKGNTDYTQKGTAEFQFTGTGVDIVGRTDNQSVILVYYVYAQDEAVRMGMVDTYYEGTAVNGLYQLPVISIQGLPHAQYRMKVYALYRQAEGGETGRFYMDGIRIYNPLGTNTEDYSEQEKNASVTPVRKMILGNTELSDQGTVPEGTPLEGALAALVYSDGASAENIYELGTTSTEVTGQGGPASASSQLNDYLVSGPKNELYLPAGSAIAFLVEGDVYNDANTLQIEAKAVNTLQTGGNNYPILVNVGHTAADAQKIEVRSSTAMYYKLDLDNCLEVGGKRLVVLANATDSTADISLTNIKNNGYTISYPEPEQIKDLNSSETEQQIGNRKPVIEGLYETYVSGKATTEVTVADAGFAVPFVKSGQAAWLNVTLRAATEAVVQQYMPQILQYTDGENTLTPVTNAEGKTLTDPVRQYTDADGNACAVYKVKMNFASEKYSRDTLYSFAVGAVKRSAARDSLPETMSQNCATASVLVRGMDWKPGVTVSGADVPTNQAVQVTLTTEEEILTPKGWMQESSTRYTRSYEENGEYAVTVEDLAGYQERVSFSISHIDRIAPAAEVMSEQLDDTHIKVTLQADEPIRELEGWTKESDTTYESIHVANGDNSVAIQDLAGNEALITYQVNGIREPEQEVKPETKPENRPEATPETESRPEAENNTDPVFSQVTSGQTYQKPVRLDVQGSRAAQVNVDGQLSDVSNAPAKIEENGTHVVSLHDEDGNTIKSAAFKIDQKEKPEEKTEESMGFWARIQGWFFEVISWISELFAKCF